MSDGPDVREQIRNAINETSPEEIEGVCVGWVLVAEWMDTEGKQWITRNDGDGAGERLTEWRRQGLLHNALHTLWPDDILSDDDDD